MQELLGWHRSIQPIDYSMILPLRFKYFLDLHAVWFPSCHVCLDIQWCAAQTQDGPRKINPPPQIDLFRAKNKIEQSKHYSWEQYPLAQFPQDPVLIEAFNLNSTAVKTRDCYCVSPGLLFTCGGLGWTSATSRVQGVSLIYAAPLELISLTVFMAAAREVVQGPPASLPTVCTNGDH